MSLRKRLVAEIRRSISVAQNDIINLREDLKIAGRINPRNTVYVAKLHSLWTDHGEQDAKVTHRGRIEDAIRKAEEKYKSVNNRTDIQARYSVKIKIGDRNYDVHKEFWGSQYADVSTYP